MHILTMPVIAACVLGQPAERSLTSDGPTREGRLFNAFAFTLEDDAALQVSVSAEFDTFVAAVSPRGSVYARNESALHEPSLYIPVPDAGRWLVLVMSNEENVGGDYVLSVTPGVTLEAPGDIAPDTWTKILDSRRANLIATRLQDVVVELIDRDEVRAQAGRELVTLRQKTIDALENEQERYAQLLRRSEELGDLLRLLQDDPDQAETQKVREALAEARSNALLTRERIDRLRSDVRVMQSVQQRLDELSKDLDVLAEAESHEHLDRQVVAALRRNSEAKWSNIIDDLAYLGIRPDDMTFDRGGVHLAWTAPPGTPLEHAGAGGLEIAWNDRVLDWPPPEPSAHDTVDRGLLPADEDVTFGDVDAAITSALDAAGYPRGSYHGVKGGGFAIVTTLERIEPDGTPAEDRWNPEIPEVRRFSLAAYLRALFFAKKGHYRVFVFVVTSHPLEQGDAVDDIEDFEAWVGKGLTMLPREVARRPFTEDHALVVLVYEFEKIRASDESMQRLPGRLNAKAHLRMSGVRWEKP